MSSNKSLNKAKSAKMDEFYTRREDIEAELSHYKTFFEGKVVYCNCDDPTWSEFWQFFVRVFRDWKIKKLMATHYEPDEKNYAYKLELTEDTGGMTLQLPRFHVTEISAVLFVLRCSGKQILW